MQFLSIWASCVALLTTFFRIKRYIQPFVLLRDISLINQLIDGGATWGTVLEQLDEFLKIAALLSSLAARRLRFSALLHNGGGPSAGLRDFGSVGSNFV